MKLWRLLNETHFLHYLTENKLSRFETICEFPRKSFTMTEDVDQNPNKYRE